MPLDKTEVKILSILQDDARMTNQELADKIGMSASPCWRKVRKLEEQGVIKGYRAVLDRKKTGSGVMVFIRVVIDCHSEAEAEKFEQQVTALEDVVACYSIGGATPIFCYRWWQPTSTLTPSLPCRWCAGCRALKRCKVCLF